MRTLVKSMSNVNVKCLSFQVSRVHQPAHASTSPNASGVSKLVAVGLQWSGQRLLKLVDAVVYGCSISGSWLMRPAG